MPKKKFYITTPIYYANDKPHIGHAYTTILADVLARYHRAEGESVFFLTGLDEHGQKVQQAAEEQGIDPQLHCDRMEPRWTQLWEKLHIRYDDFIRTTQPRHRQVVQAVLQKVYDRGDIYFDEYGGYYCVGCERFYTEKELEQGNCPQHQKPVKYITEKNYFFKMSRYQQRLVDYIHDHPEFIQPPHRRNEILGFLRQPLGDLCISRPKSRLSWGIDLPFDKDYVTYVWFDALLNYVTATGYGVDEEQYRKWWPADYHLIGKDILMTHAVYWPTMLFAVDIPLPRTIFAHGWWLSGESKMSKSLGNVVNPLELIDSYGVDPVRYYLMREMVLGQDANFTMESFVKRYNSDLANDFGNLLSRVTRLLEKHFAGEIPAAGPPTEAEIAVKDQAEALGPRVDDLINHMRVNEALEEILQFIRSINRYMESQAPWKLVKTDLSAAGRVLYTAAEALCISALLLEPVMPNRTRMVLDSLGAEDRDRQWGGLVPGLRIQPHPHLFPRIDFQAQSRKKQSAKTEKPKYKGETQPKEGILETIALDTFQKVDLRTAEVLVAERVAGTDRLMQMDVQVGAEKRQIVAGIAHRYQPEELVGKIIVIVANLQPATIRGLESQGMLLAASKGKQLSLVVLDRERVGSGATVY
jgi:methionyl-tRNA synthetase